MDGCRGMMSFIKRWPMMRSLIKARDLDCAGLWGRGDGRRASHTRVNRGARLPTHPGPNAGARRISDLINGLMMVGTVVLLLCGQPLVAKCGEWTTGVHALYFTPITSAYGYASTFNAIAPGTDTQTGEAQLVPCAADWGFRVVGDYLNDCMFAGVSYQWFAVTTTRAVTAANIGVLGALITGSGRATGQVGIEYQNVDARVGKHLVRGCVSSFYLYGNGRWVDLSYRRGARTTLTNGGIASSHEKSQLQGGAIGIGVGGEFDIRCGIGAFFDGNVLGVIGKRSLKNVEFQGFNPGFTPQIRRAKYPTETCVLPEVDFRIGINYTYMCGCWEVIGELGYEVDYFWDGSIFPNLTGVDLGLGGTREFVPVCQDLGFSGLFFGARLVF